MVLEEIELERYLIVDLETGGFKRDAHPILEIAMRCEWGRTDSSPFDFHVIIKPTEEQWAACSPHALAVNQFTWEEVQEKGVPLEQAADMLSSWLYKRHITSDNVSWVGQNGKFDIAFLQHYMNDHLEFVGLFPLQKQIEIMDLAKQLKEYDPTFKPVSLSGGSISSALELIPEESLHRAQGGVVAARQNFYALRKRIDEIENELSRQEQEKNRRRAYAKKRSE